MDTDYRYLPSGQKVVVVRSEDDHYHLIKRLNEIDDVQFLSDVIEEYEGPIFDQEPVAAYSDRIKGMQDELKTLTGLRDHIRSELNQMMAERREMERRWKKHDALVALNDFFENKTTHAVTIFRDVPHVWKINEYRNASGDWCRIYFFTSEEEATSYARGYVEERLKEYTNKYDAGRLMAQAEKLGVPIPQAYLDKHNAEQREVWMKKIQEAKKNIELYREELDKYK